MPPLCCYHWSQIIVKLKRSSFFFCQGPQSPTSGTLEPPGHHFMKGCLAHIVRTNTDTCSVESARPSLLNLFRLKVAFFVKGIGSVCTCEHLCRVSQGQRKPTGFFSLSLSSDRLLLFRQCGLTPLQQREIFKPSS